MDYTAADSQQNAITVTSGDGQITVRDAGHSVTILPFADPGCTQPTSDSARCPAQRVNVRASDMNDTIDASGASLPTVDGLRAVMLSGGDGDDQITGSPFPDEITGESGTDHLDGLDGGDSLTGGDGNDTMVGGAGNDSLEDAEFETGGDDLIEGGPGDDTLAQPQRLPASMPDGADTFHGGDGTDTASYGSAPDAVTVSLDGAPNDGYGGEGDNIDSDVENLVGGAGNDTLTGSDAENTIDGGGGDDVVAGLDGKDDLRGGADAGSDSLVGGSGDDTLAAGAGDDGLDGGDGADTIDGAGGSDTEEGGPGTDTMSGGAGIDQMDGGADPDTMRGGSDSAAGADGADNIEGGGGADQLSGEDGNDVLDGGGGSDLISGGAGEDTADYRTQQAPVAITIDDQANDGTLGENDNVVSDIEDVDGGNFDSTVVGTDGGNTLTGGSGEDYADGGPGQDVLTGGDAADTLRSRDGQPDTVECGKGTKDFAIADPPTIDNVKSCERVDVGNSKPRNGKVVVVQPVTTNLVKLPGVHRFVPLKSSDTIGLPIRSTVNPTASGVRLTAANRSGARAAGTFEGDAFLVKQGPRLTQLQLSGGDPLSKCSNRAKAGRGGSKRVLRRLFGKAHGRFRTRGRFSSATVRGTTWTVADRCDGTLTHVIRGSVIVRDFGRKRNIKVPAGHSYLARRGNR